MREIDFKLQGIVTEALHGSKFKVEIYNNRGQLTGKQVFSTIAGKLRVHFIRIVKGDIL